MAKSVESKPELPPVVPEAPLYTSPEWHDYVISHFSPEELYDGCPNVAGLRRVTELLLGPIRESYPVKTWPVEGNDVGRSTVEYRINIEFKEDNRHRTFGDVADAWVGNSDDQYIVHSPALASTRAEARCLRKALKLRGVAAEELMNKKASEQVAESLKNSENPRISSDQMNFLDLKCKQLDINVTEILKWGGTEFKNVKELSKDYVSKVIKEISRLMNNKTEIKEEIKGYKANWRE